MNRVATSARPQPTLAWRLIRSLGYLSPIRFGFGAGTMRTSDRKLRRTRRELRS
jgi:hypothetical protein